MTLFAERTIDPGHLVLTGTPEKLTVRHPVVQAAAAHLAIPLTRRRR